MTEAVLCWLPALELMVWADFEAPTHSSGCGAAGPRSGGRGGGHWAGQHGDHFNVRLKPPPAD